MREKGGSRGLEGMKNRNARKREGEMVRQRRSRAPIKDIFMMFRPLITIVRLDSVYTEWGTRCVPLHREYNVAFHRFS